MNQASRILKKKRIHHQKILLQKNLQVQLLQKNQRALKDQKANQINQEAHKDLQKNLIVQ